MRLTITLFAATMATTVFSVTSFTPAPDKGHTDTLHNHLFTVGVGAGLNQVDLVEGLVGAKRGAAEDRASIGQITHRGSQVDVLRIRPWRWAA